MSAANLAPPWDCLLLGARAATMDAPDYGLIDDAAIGVKDGLIAWVGAKRDLPDAPTQMAARLEHCGGLLATPGLIDCHTHLVYAGNRAAEFEMRLNGARYEDIAAAGGGILSTVRATRAAGEAHLITETLPRLDRLIGDGVTTLEIKSGYGLSLEAELAQLSAARALAQHRRVGVRTTLLAAHAVAPEFVGDGDAYVRHVCDTILPAAAQAGLADAVDVFCESIGFTPAQTRTVFEAARAHNLPVKLHADQLSDLGGAALAASFAALSADHLEYTSEEGVRAMAASGTVAVLLPGAFYALRETQAPPIEALRAHRVAMAVSTDCNPGTSPMTSLLLALNMACTLFRLTPHEALAGATVHAARALGLHDRGALRAGLRADIALWRVRHPAELSYAIGATPLARRMFEGKFD
jgi:imidazolonepropionase